MPEIEAQRHFLKFERVFGHISSVSELTSPTHWKRKYLTEYSQIKKYRWVASVIVFGAVTEVLDFFTIKIEFFKIK